MENKETKKETFAEGAWDFLKSLMISMAAVFILSNFVIRPIEVEGDSMYPTLHSGSIGLANIIGRKMDGIRRFDIAIIYIKESNKYLVKRVVGLPNETVSCHDGVLYINEEPVDEPFLSPDYKAQFSDVFTAEIEPVTLGPDEYYCLGDNRPSSRDSRYYGPFRESQIAAKGALILYPFDQFGVRSW